MDSHTAPISDPLAAAADEFITRFRKGDRPTIGEYVDRYPDLANRIRDLFPKLLEQERRANKAGATAPFAPMAHMPEVPQYIGDYRIVREVGRGGMGIVYEAVQESLSRQVALKVLPSGPLMKQAYLERFRREARSVARLHHANIVPVFGVGESNGLHYYAMQFIHGQGLDTVLRSVRLSRGIGTVDLHADNHTVDMLEHEFEEELLTDHFDLGPSVPESDRSAVDTTPNSGEAVVASAPELSKSEGQSYFRLIAQLGVQVASAIEYAHSKGVLHRDVKPSNLLLDRQGTIWITDFGLAKAEGDDLTGSGDIVGTLRYMAPERFQGRSDTRSDIYAIGMTLYEMLALKPAFEEEDRLELINRINKANPTPLRLIDRNIPRDLETIVLKAISRSSQHRYRTAGELAEDLSRFLNDQPIMARRTSYWEHAVRWCRRNPAVALLLMAVAALLVGLGVAVTRWNFELQQERDVALWAKRDAEAARSYEKERAWGASVDSARAWRNSRRSGQRFNSLAAITSIRDRKTGWPSRVDVGEMRSLAIACLALPDLRIDREWDGWDQASHRLDFDDGFDRYARSEKTGRISLRWLADDAEIAVLPGRGFPSVPLFSPSGKYLSVWHETDGCLQVFATKEDSPRLVAEEPANAVGSFGFSDDETQFVYARLDGSVFNIDLSTGQRKSITTGQVPTCLARHPTRPLVAMAVGTEVKVLDLDEPASVPPVLATGLVRFLAWRGDQHLAVGLNGGRIAVWDVDRRKLIFTSEGHRGELVALAFSHSGELLASGGEDGTVRLWDPRTGRQLFSTQTTPVRLRFSKNDKWLGAGLKGSRIVVWETAAGNEYRTLVRDPSQGKGMYRDASVHPDGRLLAVAMDDGVRIWDLETSAEVAALSTGRTACVLFRPNGELLSSGGNGVFAWPVTRDQASSGTICIGPPRQLATWDCEGLACSRDGQVVVTVARGQGAVILDRDRPALRQPLLNHGNSAYVAVSPDGRWLATGTQTGNRVKIWDAKSEQLAHELPVESGSMVCFSPDNLWLATNSEGAGCQLWEVGIWRKRTAVASSPKSRAAFSPDGQILAVETGFGVVRLLDPLSGLELARLEDPDQDRAGWLGFSPDGTRLITTTNDNQCVHVWDLLAIRQGLNERFLDWTPRMQLTPRPSQPPLPPVSVIGESLLSVRNRSLCEAALTSLVLSQRPDFADGYCWRAEALTHLGWNDAALADFDRAIELDPNNSDALYLRGQEFFRRRNYEPALQDFTTAMNHPRLHDSARWMRGKVFLQLDRVDDMLAEVEALIARYPNDPQLYYQRALGYAHDGQVNQSIADLEKALKLSPNYLPAMNNLAWVLVTGPEKFRDAEKALNLARRTTQSAPEKGTYKNTLGVALYRLGQFSDAAAALEASLVAGKGQFDGYDLYFLAMCNAKLGRSLKAKECYEKAHQWHQSARLSRHEADELEGFRVEAVQVMQ